MLVLYSVQCYTQPAKQTLAARCDVCREENLLHAPKRGFNPPIDPWLRGPLAAQLENLGATLTTHTQGQIAAARADALIQAWREHRGVKAEHILQLLLLAVSLTQLRERP